MLFHMPARPAPFIKWVGGKRSLAPLIADMAPQHIPSYLEPFLGGGAVFFHMEGRIASATLSDAGPELIQVYQVVRDSPGELIELIEDHAHNHHDVDYYYRIRAQHHLDEPVAATARFLYLNATGFNGLFRVNSRGEFNVARGSYKNPTICDPEQLMAASIALRKADIRRADFSEVRPEPGSFVYCDPPHDGTYAGYTVHRFEQNDQIRLRDHILQWTNLGATVMCSNADTGFIRNIYQDPPFHIRQVWAPRSISADGNTRGRVSELLITNHGP